MSWRCLNCETLNSDTLRECEVCGWVRIVDEISEKDSTTSSFETVINKSGTSNPKCLHQFNWGAFYLTFLWGIFNRIWWTLLCLIPFVNIIISIWMGIKGNQYAWKKQKESKTSEQFDKSQRDWNVIGWWIFVWGMIFVLIILRNS